MNFKIKNYTDTALTPNLGGEVDGLVLKIKRLTHGDKSENAKKLLNDKMEPDLKNIEDNLTEIALSLVVGWNAEPEYDENVKNENFIEMLDDDTGILNEEATAAEEKRVALANAENKTSEEAKPVYFSLRSYIIHFAGDRSNFLAD